MLCFLFTEVFWVTSQVTLVEAEGGTWYLAGKTYWLKQACQETVSKSESWHFWTWLVSFELISGYPSVITQLKPSIWTQYKGKEFYVKIAPDWLWVRGQKNVKTSPLKKKNLPNMELFIRTSNLTDEHHFKGTYWKGRLRNVFFLLKLHWVLISLQEGIPEGIRLIGKTYGDASEGEW